MFRRKKDAEELSCGFEGQYLNIGIFCCVSGVLFGYKSFRYAGITYNKYIY